MNLTATINQVFTTGPDELNPVFNFSLTDGDDTQEVSFTGTISLAMADYIDRFEPESDSPSAFRKMIKAICHYEPSQLAGCEFES